MTERDERAHVEATDDLFKILIDDGFIAEIKEDDGYQHGADATCYDCGHELTPAEQDRDKCGVCGRHYHDDLEDHTGEDND